MPLITSISELKDYISIDANTKWATIEKYVKEAEQLFVVDLLGKAFYDEYLPLYVNKGVVPLSAENAALLPYIQRCLAYYAQLKAIPAITTAFGELGLRVHRSEDSDAAARWKEEKILLGALINGDLHADKLLAFLEENEDDYPTWKNSTANTRLSGLIVYSTTKAQKHININNSRRVFLQLAPTIAKLEAKYVPRLVGADQYAELVDQLKTDLISEENMALIALIEPIIAKRALYMQIPFMQVSVGADGIRVYSEVTEIRSKDYLATREQIKELRCSLSDSEELGYPADEEELHQFILENADTYPLIKASTAYTVQPDPGPTWDSLNDPDNNYFAV